MPNVSAILDPDIFNLLENECKNSGMSKSMYVKKLLENRLTGTGNTEQSTETFHRARASTEPHKNEEKKELTAEELLREEEAKEKLEHLRKEKEAKEAKQEEERKKQNKREAEIQADSIIRTVQVVSNSIIDEKMEPIHQKIKKVDEIDILKKEHDNLKNENEELKNKYNHIENKFGNDIKVLDKNCKTLQNLIIKLKNEMPYERT